MVPISQPVLVPELLFGDHGLMPTPRHAQTLNQQQLLLQHDLVKEVQCIPGVQLLAPLLHLCLGRLPMWLLRHYRVEGARSLGEQPGLRGGAVVSAVGRGGVC